MPSLAPVVVATTWSMSVFLSRLVVSVVRTQNTHAVALQLGAGISKVVTMSRLVRGGVVLLIKQPPLLLTLIEGLQTLAQSLRIARCLWIVIGAGQMSGTLSLRSVDVALHRTSAQDPALSAHHRVLLTTVTVLLNHLKSQFVLCHLCTSADRGFLQEPTAQ